MAAAVLGVTAPTSASAATPTSTSVTDPANDVMRHGSARTNFTADLDLRKVSATTRGRNVLVTVRVADLKPAHLQERVKDGWHSIPSNVSAMLYFGNLRWQIQYGTEGTAAAFASMLNQPSKQLPDPCPSPDPAVRSLITQRADYVKNSVTFTIPVSCLPASAKEARINGMTQWTTGTKPVTMWDDFHPKGNYGKPDVRSKPFRFR
jgi:hypothetical protein